MPRVLLILPTGTYRAAEYLAAAERLGTEVFIASERAQAMAAQMGERFLEVPLESPERAAARIVEHSRRDPRLALDAVLAVDDQGLVAAAIAAAELGLTHSPEAAVRLTRDKAAMRQAFASAGVHQPSFEVVTLGAGSTGSASSTGGSSTGGARVAAAARRIGCPVVVKPVSLSASRGVIRADSPEAAAVAAERIVAILADAGEPPSPLLVESFVPGPEVAVEGLVRNGEAAVLTIFDKPDPLDGPYFEETLYTSPSRLPPHLRLAVETEARHAVAALGLTEGPFHAELRVPRALREGPPVAVGAQEADGREGPPVAVIEVAARTIGGRCSKAMTLANGWGLEELVMANALGAAEAWPPPALAGPCGILMIPIPKSGVLRGVGGLEEVRELAGITGVEVTIPVGRPVRALPEGDRYLGFVFAACSSATEVEAVLREARRLLVVDIGPSASE